MRVTEYGLVSLGRVSCLFSVHQSLRHWPEPTHSDELMWIFWWIHWLEWIYSHLRCGFFLQILERHETTSEPILYAGPLMGSWPNRWVGTIVISKKFLGFSKMHTFAWNILRYCLNRPFPHPNKQWRRVEVRVDKNTVNVWKCPPQPRSGVIILTHWSGKRLFKKIWRVFNGFWSPRYAYPESGWFLFTPTLRYERNA